MTTNFRNIPKELIELPRWVCWKLVERDGKPTKIPVNPLTGSNAMSDNSNTWSSFNRAYSAMKTAGYSGVGFMFNGDGILGVDIDHCVDPDTGKLSDLAKDIISTLDSYTELSQSRTGVHIICRGKLPEGRRRKDPVEMYEIGRFFCITGNTIDDSHTDIEERTEQLAIIHSKYVNKAPGKAVNKDSALPANGDYLSIGLMRDSLLLAIWNGQRDSADESANDMAFMNKLAYWCNSNVDQMVDAFCRSPYAAQKDPKHINKIERKDYLKRTAVRAVADLKSTAANDNSAYKNNQAKKDFSEKDPQKESLNKPLETKIICLDDIDVEDVKWIWMPYIPLGKLTLVQGDPGDGKTTFVLNVASIISRGDSFPGEFPIEPGNIIYQTAEDGIADTIKPRLLSAEADCSRIFVIDESQQSLSLSDERIESAMKQLQPKLFIIDPLQAYLGADVDMHRANEVRPILKNIGHLAEKYNCAVVMIMHLSKQSQSRSLYRGLGTIDIPAAARSVLLVGKNPNNPQERAIAHVKSSLAPAGKSIAFELNPSWGSVGAVTVILLLMICLPGEQ